MKLKDLSPEMKERAKQCKTPQDVLALAKEEGYELSDEELDSIAGGVEWCYYLCTSEDCWSHY